MRKIWAFIGGGAMAGAIIGGAKANGVIAPQDIYVSDHKEKRCQELKDLYDINAMVGSEGFISKADYVVLAIKPQVADKAINEIKGKLKTGAVVISIVAGLTIDSIQQLLPEQPVVRVMPNTPLSVGEGMSAYALSPEVADEAADDVKKLFEACGKAVEVKEYMLDAVTGLSGSGPAYGFLVIDALSDGGVAAGLPRQTATLLAAQTILGAAKMVLETGKHPDMLRDQVTSPAGTTIAGVRVMEQQGVRGAMIDAVIAAADRSKELGKK